MRLTRPVLAVLTIGLIAAVPSAQAGFTEYIIRSNPVINHPAPGEIEFVISAGGQKAGLGSNDINGQKIGDIQQVAITRLDDHTRFPAGSGPMFAPYLNIWITNGAGKFAVVANEPTNPDMQPLYSNGWDFSFADLSNKAAKIFENADMSWLPNNGVGLTFADLAGFTIQAPTVAELAANWAGLGTGAPREFGTNVAYGVNWIFGDTLQNYVAGADGYIVKDAKVQGSAAAVPETASFSVWGLGLLALLIGRRSLRRQQ